MCSFLIYNGKIVKNLDQINRLLKLRGPDHTNLIEMNGYNFIHNLLYICGEKTIQPFVSDDQKIICLFNGEIYNYKKFGDFKSDGMCLIPAYQKYGTDFIRHLDGEFAIFLWDFETQKIILSSDIFATKPMFYSIKNVGDKKEIYVSSLQSCLHQEFNIPLDEIQKVEANTTMVLDSSKEFTEIEKKTVYDFDLQQHKTDMNDWVSAFERAVLKRINHCNNKIFITLSSGYDSGCLDFILKTKKIKFKSYTIIAKENKRTLNYRFNFFPKYGKNVILGINKKNYAESEKFIAKNIDDVISTIHNSVKGPIPHTPTNWASVGLNLIFLQAVQDKRKVYLSGQGPDEIMGDYGFNGNAIKAFSEIKGKFPKNLKKIFPWRNFFEGTMRSFISKEEGVASLHGIEARYPYLDREVVQEYLWLSHNIKNTYYKAPLYHLMSSYGYPFDFNVKIGFKCYKGMK